MRSLAALFLLSSVVVWPLSTIQMARGALAPNPGDVADRWEAISDSPATGHPGMADSGVTVAQASFSTGTITVSKNLARQTAERENGGLNNYRAEPAMHGPALDAPFRDGGETWIFTFRGGAPGEEFTVESEVAVNKTSLETNILYNGPLRAASAADAGEETEPEPATPDPVATDPRQPEASADEVEAQDPADEAPADVVEEPAPEVVAEDPEVEPEPEVAEPEPEVAESEQPAAEDPVATGEAAAMGEATQEPTAAAPSTEPTPAPRRRSLRAPGDVTTAKNFARQAAERLNGGLGNYSAELSMHGPALESPFRDDGDRWIFTFRGGFPGDISLPIESEVAVMKATLETTVLYNGPLRSGTPGEF